MATPAQQLENELVNRPDRVMVVAGIGVSLATCGNHPCASWQGLLQHGLQQCQEICGTDSNLIHAQCAILNNPRTPTHGLIGVGQFITDELTNNRPGLFAKWLCDSIGGITVIDTGLVRALACLGVRLSTTNYDNMIEVGTGCQAITWKDSALAAAFIRESSQHILHLHGYYERPESVVLGTRGYTEIYRDEFFQTFLRSWMIFGTVVFVGCGAGLEDPNFGVLLDWTRTVLAKCRHSHFILVRSGELEDWRERLRGISIDPVRYGTEYRDLTPFIEDLARQVQQRRDPRAVLFSLSASQTDFDAQWEELERNRETLSLLEYFQRSRMLAAELWGAGGHRRAAMAFSGRLTFQGQHLLIPEYVEFALDAAEWLLGEDLPSLASHHLGDIGQKLESADFPAQHLTRFRRLRVRCMDALCAYTEALRAIEEALPHADHGERCTLEAERSEIHFLQGDFAQAIADTE